jgi:class 3 adenylate cyclase
MNCAGCGHINPDHARFCLECGDAMALRCTGCRATLPPASKFCLECGMKVAAVATNAGGTARAAESADDARLAPLLSIAPRHLADKILHSRAAIQGERKQVTVLFADVKGSMDLAEQMDPEAWSGIMQRFFGILADGVERYEGFVDKFTGDGIMALFGAPIAHEDHAQRACYAALHLKEELARYATELKRVHGLGFSTRMGLHSGEVVVGSIGDDLRMEYTAQGHTVGLAQRMESLASPDTCYLSASTAALVMGYVELEDLGEFRVKGMREPVGVHRLVGPGTSRTRFDISRSRGLTRFVGRDSDMRTLEEALAEAQAGRGQVVGLVAEAGTGKSRLCHEFAERCRARGLVVNFGSALAHGKHIPYLPMLQVFRAYYGIGDNDDDRTARERIAGRLLLADEGARDILPVAFEFFGVPDPARPAPRMDPDAKQRAIFAVLRQGIQDADAAADRLVVVIEDLHWFDAASEALLATWVDALAGTSALLVVNFRPEYQADWMQRSWYRRLPVAPLGPEATRELLGDLLGDDASVAKLADRIHEQTGGNPFFTEEVVQALVDGGDLVGTRGAYRLAVDAATIRVPASVHGILAARIDRLSECDKLVLQTAAVVGQTFAEPIVAAVAELPEQEIRAALSALQAGEFVYEQTPFPVAEYSFKHPLTREVALASQLQQRRRALHAAAARAIEGGNAEKLESHAALLAHHWEEAGDNLAAAAWQMRAARWLRTRDFPAAAHHARRALELLKREPDAPETPALGAEVCRELLALSLRVSFPHEENERIFDEGRAWAETIGDAELVARLHQGMAVMCTMDGQPKASLRHAAEWERTIIASPDAELRACAKWPRIGPLLQMGEIAIAREAICWQLDAVTGHPTWGLRDWGLSALANGLLENSRVEMFCGNLALARALAEQCLQVARGVGDLEDQFGAHMRLAGVAWYSGEHDAFRAAIGRLVEVAEKSGSEWLRGEAEAWIATRLLHDGQAQAAFDVLERKSDEVGSPRLSNHSRLGFQSTLVECTHRLGSTERARSIAEIARTTLRDRGMMPALAELNLILAGILAEGAEPTDFARMEGLLDEVDEIVRSTGAHLFTPFAMERRATLATLRGDEAQQSQWLREAHRLFVQMGATGHAGRIGTDLARLHPSGV